MRLGFKCRSCQRSKYGCKVMTIWSHGALCLAIILGMCSTAWASKNSLPNAGYTNPHQILVGVHQQMMRSPLRVPMVPAASFSTWRTSASTRKRQGQRAKGSHLARVAITTKASLSCFVILSEGDFRALRIFNYDRSRTVHF